jgi:hypothetical protein
MCWGVEMRLDWMVSWEGTRQCCGVEAWRVCLQGTGMGAGATGWVLHQQLGCHTGKDVPSFGLLCWSLDTLWLIASRDTWPRARVRCTFGM